MTTRYQNFRGYKECNICGEVKGKTSFNKKDFELLQCSGEHKNMHCCKNCFKEWKTTKEQQGQQLVCPLCRGRSFASKDILQELLGANFGKISRRTRKIYMGPRGGFYYKVKGNKVYI